MILYSNIHTQTRFLMCVVNEFVFNSKTGHNNLLCTYNVMSMHHVSKSAKIKPHLEVFIYINNRIELDYDTVVNKYKNTKKAIEMHQLSNH